jgi:hypothetical protein
MANYDLETSVVVNLKKPLPENYLERVGREVVRTIQERTARGLDKDGRAFQGYSEDYIDSLEFRIARKSPSQVNLRLSGEMMTDLEVLDIDSQKGRIVVGYKSGESQDKAHGHITGANGKLPVRDFMGVSKEEIATILSKVPEPSRLSKAEGILEQRLSKKEKQPDDRGFNPPGVEIEDLFGILDEIAREAEMY